MKNNLCCHCNEMTYQACESHGGAILHCRMANKLGGEALLWRQRRAMPYLSADGDGVTGDS